MQIILKAATMWRLAFSITFLALFVACEDPGTVGGGFIEKTEIDIDTISISTLAPKTIDAYTGRLGRSPIGKFDDGLFGTKEAISFFKPSITRSSDSFLLSDTTKLVLKLQLWKGDIYGDTSSTNNYSVYRISSGTEWRGSSYKMSDAISFEESELIGQFSTESADTSGLIDVELTGSWREDYINHFNREDDVRDEEYRDGDFGLALIPDAVNSNISYVSFSTSGLQAIQTDTTNHFILDWGFDITSSGGINDPTKTTLQSTFDNVLTLNLAEIADQLENINYIRAELVFTEDTLSIDNSLRENEVRTNGLGVGLTLGPLNDEAYEIGFGDITLSTFKVDGKYTINITALLNNYLFGSTDLDQAYLFLIANDGVLSYTSLFSSESGLEFAPKIIIYGLGSGELEE